jgi:hypothetical protein
MTIRSGVKRRPSKQKGLDDIATFRNDFGLIYIFLINSMTLQDFRMEQQT